MKKKIQGFSLIEGLIALAIFMFLVYLSSVSFVSIQRTRVLETQSWQVVTLLREAQNKSASGIYEGGILKYGVLFAEDSCRQFATLTDFPSRILARDFELKLPESLRFTQRQFFDNCLDFGDCVIFEKLTGTVSAQSSVKIEEIKSGRARTIIINREGAVEVE